MSTITISLPESLKNFVNAQLAAKGYGNVSEYFRSLLRTAQKEDEDAQLEKLLLEGLAGTPITVTDEFWRNLKTKAARRKAEWESKKEP